MRAIYQEAFGEPADVLAWVEKEVPEPGVGQVRIRVKLSPIHNHDLLTVQGTYGFVPDLPAPAVIEAWI